MIKNFLSPKLKYGSLQRRAGALTPIPSAFGGATGRVFFYGFPVLSTVEGFYGFYRLLITANFLTEISPFSTRFFALAKNLLASKTSISTGILFLVK